MWKKEIIGYCQNGPKSPNSRIEVALREAKMPVTTVGRITLLGCVFHFQQRRHWLTPCSHLIDFIPEGTYSSGNRQDKTFSLINALENGQILVTWFYLTWVKNPCLPVICGASLPLGYFCIATIVEPLGNLQRDPIGFQAWWWCDFYYMLIILQTIIGLSCKGCATVYIRWRFPPLALAIRFYSHHTTP